MTEPRFEKLGARTLSHSSFLRLDRLHIVGPNGEAMPRESVMHPGAVAIVPIVDSPHGEEVVLIDQYRAPIDQMLLELPAGKLDIDGEDRVTAAHRELAEEVGLLAGSLEPLVGFYTGPGFTDEYITLYVARECVVTETEPDGIEEETATIVRISVADIPQLIETGRINDAKTQIGLLMYYHRTLV